MKICYKKILPISNSLIIGRSVSYKGKTWDVGQTIKVGFLGGSDVEKNVVKQVYSEVSDFANLNFIYSDDLSDTDVRWSFIKGDGSWSYIGTDSLFIPKNKPTVNIGWTVDLDVVRHEAGHSIGLMHEHMNPNGGINWNREKVIADLSSPPNNWSVQDIERNVLNTLNPDSVNATDYDPDSVMLYFFPDDWVVGGEGTKMNVTWSVGDKTHLEELYPKSTIIEYEFLKSLFDSKDRLGRLTEDQLLVICKKLDIIAKKEDLKKDTVDKIFNKLYA